MLLQAMPWIKEEFPDAVIYSTGEVGRNRYTSHPVRNSYENFLFYLIKKYQLDDSVYFLGYLDEKQMRERFLKSHVYVNTSSIENESNALSEAKILLIDFGFSCINNLIYYALRVLKKTIYS